MDSIYESEYEVYLNRWFDGIESEISFWDSHIATCFCDPKYQYQIGRKFTLDDDIPEDAYGRDYYFLDVGSGPYSRCGFHSDKVKLHAVAVDSLAEIYQLLKDKYSAKNEIQLKNGFVEFLNQIFPANSFDMVHMSNALDHSFDPFLGILNMLRVAKMGGVIILEHVENEAVNENYVGLHQWNLSVKMHPGRFIIWNHEKTIDVTEQLCKYVDFTIVQDVRDPDGKMVFQKVIMKKKKEVQIPHNNLQKIFLERAFSYILQRSLNHVENAGDSYSVMCRRRLDNINWCNLNGSLHSIKKVDIYGYGKIGRKLADTLIQAGISIGQIMDRQPVCYRGIQAKPLDTYSYQKADFVVITIPTVYSELKKHFNKVGVPENKIFLANQFLDILENQMRELDEGK